MKIFVSYRRDDTAGYAGRLNDDLAERLGDERIFFDVDTIRAGRDFTVAIKEAVDQSTVVLALIGPSWLVHDDAGVRRIDNPEDWVRLEIATALEAGKTVIPVLLGGARMPSRANLPAPLAGLASRQSFVISHARWRADVESLIAELNRIEQPPEPSRSHIAGDVGLDPLIGRDDDLAAVLGELERARLVTLTGAGGSGKSRLAEAAVDSFREHRRPAWFVDLSAVEDSSLVGVTIMTALRLEGQGTRDPLDVVADSIAGEAVLLAPDNLEQIEDVGRPLAGLLRAAPGLRVLATSRVPLGVRGEVEIAVQTLALPADATPAAIESSAAGALFLARARALGRLRTLDATTAADISELLRFLDGLPLAIELAAARTRAMSPGEILRRLRREGLESIDRGGGDRHRSLRAIFEWTRGLLSPDQVRCLEAVSMCAGFDLELAEAVVADAAIDVVDALESLVALGLVATAPSIDGASRFRLLETIRTMAQEQLPAERRVQLQDRHAAWYLDRSEAWAEQSLGGWTNALIDRLDAEADNIRRALDRLEVAAPREALALASNLEAFWQTRGRMAEGMARLEAEEGLSPEPSPELAFALAQQIRMGDPFGGPVAARELTDRTIDTARVVGHRLALIIGLGNRLMQAAAKGERATADEAWSELAALDPEALGVHERIQLLFAMCSAAAALHGPASDDTLAASRDFYAAAVASGRASWQAIGAGNLAQTLRGAGKLEEAATLAAAAVEAFRRLDRTSGLAWALSDLGSILAELGRPEEAVAALVESADMAAVLKLDGLASDTLRSAVPVALSIGKAALAARLWGAVLELGDRGRFELQLLDREVGERWLTKAAKALSSDELAAAIDEGRRADPIALLHALPAELRGD